MSETLDRDGRPLSRLLIDSACAIRKRIMEGHETPIPAWTVPDLISLLEDAADAVESSCTTEWQNKSNVDRNSPERLD